MRAPPRGASRAPRQRGGGGPGPGQAEGEPHRRFCEAATDGSYKQVAQGWGQAVSLPGDPLASTLSGELQTASEQDPISSKRGTSAGSGPGGGDSTSWVGSHPTQKWAHSHRDCTAAGGLTTPT